MATGHDMRCPIRLGEACTLCQPGVEGPVDCGLVYLVRNDPDLWQRRAELLQERRSNAAG